jgi:OPA family glycerol-3-phosphate transporter-like MFS transporter
MFSFLFRFFRPAPPIPRLPEDQIDHRYKVLRAQILESTFIGYTIFYFVRNNFPIVSKEIGESLSYSKDQLGDILALHAIAYGLGKFLMGSLSDRSNPRVFMPVGLVLSAGLNFCFGWSDSFAINLSIWVLNGLVQGMGWPPCGRSLGHWYSVKERGSVFAVWNIAHNVGGGLIAFIAAYAATYYGWRYAFYIPGIISLFTAVYLFWRLRDTPQSEGLPPVEEYKNDYPESGVTHEEEIPLFQLIFHHVLLNKYIWIFAIANLFVYTVRYSIIDWAPYYLKEIKGADLAGGGYSTVVYEFAGIASTLMIGWISDKVGGRRGMVSLLCLIPILFALVGIMMTPAGYFWIDLTLFGVIGFFIYPPVMLLGVAGLDFTSKKAVGTAAGFIGFIGQFGRTLQAKALGFLSENYSWDEALGFIILSCLLAILILVFTWRLKPQA